MLAEVDTLFLFSSPQPTDSVLLFCPWETMSQHWRTSFTSAPCPVTSWDWQSLGSQSHFFYKTLILQGQRISVGQLTTWGFGCFNLTPCAEISPVSRQLLLSVTLTRWAVHSATLTRLESFTASGIKLQTPLSLAYVLYLFLSVYLVHLTWQ